jgi:hypothetical protein
MRVQRGIENKDRRPGIQVEKTLSFRCTGILPKLLMPAMLARQIRYVLMPSCLRRVQGRPSIRPLSIDFGFVGQ